MPIYEFRCHACGRKTTALVMSRDRVGEVRCRACGGADLEKLFSRFATPKSDEARLDALDDPAALGDVDENDPDSLRRYMKRMGREMGEDLGDDFDEAIDKEMSRQDGAGEDEGSDEG